MNSTNIAPPLAGRILGSTNEIFAIAEWRDPGGPPGPPRLIAPYHVHYEDDEAWYVLEGMLCVQVGEKEVRVPAGAAAMVPRGTLHTFWNPTPEPVRYLLIMTANILRLINEIHAMQDRTPEKMQALFRKHKSELVNPPPSCGT